MPRIKNHVKAVLFTRTQKQTDSLIDSILPSLQRKNKRVPLALHFLQLKILSNNDYLQGD